MNLKSCPPLPLSKKKRSVFQQTLLIMRLIILLTILSCFKVTAAVYAQQISLNLKDAPIEKVLDEIKKQSGFSLITKDDLFVNASKVTISVKNASIRHALDECFKNQPLTYELVGKTIVVKPRAISKENKMKESALSDKPIDVTGEVTDEKGQPLPGATIHVKFTRLFTSTNDAGYFKLSNVSDSVVLVVSYIGYKTKEILISANGALPLMIKMELDNSGLKEVIVSTGYQQIPLERATGSFSFVGKQALDRKVSTGIISKLEGITSGLVFNVNPDGTKELGIRGRSTIFAYSQPLIVVDNFPYDGDITNINPNDVESVSVLKDAAAASIWGVRAGNGVIVITTRRGKLNQPLHVEINSSVTVSAKPNLLYDPNFLDAADFINVEKTLYKQGFYNSDLADPTAPPFSPVVSLLNAAANGSVTKAQADAEINALKNNDVRNDLKKYFYRNAVSLQHNINLTGGTDKTTYTFSAGYDKDLASQVGNQYDRVTINSQNSFNLTKDLQLTAGLNYTESNSDNDAALSNISTGGPYGKRIYPYAQLADNQGSPLPIVKDYSTSFVTTAAASGLLNWQFFPLNEKGLYTSNIKIYDTRLNTGLRYNILKGLNADIKYQYERALTPSQSLADAGSYYARNMVNEYSAVTNGTVSAMPIPAGGIFRTGNTDLASNNFRGQLNYAADWKQNAINAIAGVEVRQVQVSGTGNVLYGYDKSTGNYQAVNFADQFQQYPSGNYATIPAPPTPTGTLNRYRSYFANASYTYNQLYTLSASGRIDQSNLFGVSANQRSVPLWSAGVKWDIDKEAFYHLQWLPVLKLRATYGFNGNLDNSLAALTTFMYNQNALLTNANYANVNNAPNANLRWEKDAMLNLGIDFGLERNILTGSLEYFSKKGTDLIGDESLAPSVGYTGTNLNYNYRGNFSDMQGHGIDVTLNSININRAFRWTSRFLFSYAIDKVTRYDETISPVQYLSADGISGPNFIYPMVGKPVYGVYSFRWGGLDPQTGDPRGYIDGQLSEDYTKLNNPSTTNELVYNGPSRPTMFGGLGNTFSYRHFSLTANFSYKLGYYFRRTSINYAALYNSWVGNVDFTKRWQQPGDEKSTNVPSMPSTVNAQRDNFYLGSSALVDKGDHVRLQDVSFSYDLDKRDFRGMPFSHLQVYLYASNLGIIWRANKDHLDPDYPQGGIPAPHSIAVGIKAGF